MPESIAIFSVEAATRDLYAPSFVSLVFCLLGIVAYSEYSLQLPFAILYGEYFVRFPCRWCFLPCDHGLDFDISLLCENSTNQSMKQNGPKNVSTMSRFNYSKIPHALGAVLDLV